LTVGDNIYPKVPDAPSDEEFESILNNFKKPGLSKLPVYAVRGNHDCEFDWKRELFLNKTLPTWTMPYLYYKKEIILDNNKKLGILFVDSCTLLCSNFSFMNQSDGGEWKHQ
jgi:predicted MPP superfamily phosphohydrolase